MAACALLLAETPASAVLELICVVHHHLYYPAHVQSKPYLLVLLTRVQALHLRKRLKSCEV